MSQITKFVCSTISILVTTEVETDDDDIEDDDDVQT